ncbi:glycoside hydrolase family 2 protein [Streptomyces sp. NPDC056831]|uniref:glycoside hydrolase family 2 protein n=1 Tax=Streptomyces sp. NPDC056831 TaxID=3345954 RepID=UPI0036C0F62B
MEHDLCGQSEEAEEALRWVEPAGGELSGLIDITVEVPQDTRSIRFSMGGVAFAELTDDYAQTTRSAPVWHTVTESSWHAPGRQLLEAEVVTPRGTFKASRWVVNVSEAESDRDGDTRILSLSGAWQFLNAQDVPAQCFSGESPNVVCADVELPWENVRVPSSFGAVRARWNAYKGTLYAYRREFEIEVESNHGKGRFLLVFSSCYFAAEVYLNDVRVGASIGGYLPVRLDVTDQVRAGVNRVVLVGDNRLSEIHACGVGSHRDMYWNWGGILQEVDLCRTDAVDLLDVAANGAQDGTLELRFSGINATGRHADIYVDIEVGSPEGGAVLSERRRIRVDSDGSCLQSVSLKLKNPTLWSLQDPVLYHVTVRTSSIEGRCLRTRAGFRTVEARGNKLLLNGEEISHLAGINRHADYPGLGRTEPAGLSRRELQRLHDMGFRVIRPGHYPATAGLLDAADELGMLVIEEINISQTRTEQLVDPGVQEFARQQLSRMVARDWGHPSVIIWSVANEIPSHSNEAADYASTLISYGRSLDTSRLWTQSSPWLMHDRTYDVLDIILINLYAGWYYGVEENAAELVRLVADLAGDKPVMVAEYGAEAVAGRKGTHPGTEEAQARLVDTYQSQLRGVTGLVATMYWTSTEYVWGLEPIGGYPDPVRMFNTKGLLTWNRQPKLAAQTFFAPARVSGVAIDAIRPGDTAVGVNCVVSIEALGSEAAGTLAFELPAGLAVIPATPGFALEAGESQDITVRIEGPLAVDLPLASVHPVLACGRRGVSRPLLLRMDGTGAPLALDAGAWTAQAPVGWAKLTAQSTFSPGAAFGWLGPGPQTLDWGGEELVRDLLLDYEPRTLRLSIAPGNHVLQVLTGDKEWPTWSLKVEVDGDLVAKLPERIGFGGFRWLAIPLQGGEQGRCVDIRFSADTGCWKIGALTVAPAREQERKG